MYSSRHAHDIFETWRAKLHTTTTIPCSQVSWRESAIRGPTPSLFPGSLSPALPGALAGQERETLGTRLALHTANMHETKIEEKLSALLQNDLIKPWNEFSVEVYQPLNSLFDHNIKNLFEFRPRSTPKQTHGRQNAPSRYLEHTSQGNLFNHDKLNIKLK